jgi:hypothetical protein
MSSTSRRKPEIKDTTTSFAQKVRSVTGVNSREDSSDGPETQPPLFLTWAAPNYSPNATNFTSFVPTVRGRVNNNFHGNPSKGSRNNSYKVQSSPRKNPLIIGRKLPNIQDCSEWDCGIRCAFSGKSLSWKLKYMWQRHRSSSEVPLIVGRSQPKLRLL